jgi:hypothetical protein
MFFRQLVIWECIDSMLLGSYIGISIDILYLKGSPYNIYDTKSYYKLFLRILILLVISGPVYMLHRNYLHKSSKNIMWVKPLIII